MTTTPEVDIQLVLGQTVMRPEVRVGAGRTPLARAVAKKLLRVVVDQHVALPDTFELVFLDSGFDVLQQAGLQMGAKVQILAGSRTDTAGHPLLEGEVIAFEGTYGERYPLTRVRGCTLDHRLQRVRRIRTFVNAKDSDVARQLAGDAGVPVGTVDATAQVHPVLAQENQTDWEFLRERAEEIGYEIGVEAGKLCFRKARGADGAAVKATLGLDLLQFNPRITSAGLVPEVEVRAWDPVNAKAKATSAPISASTVSIGAGDAASAARTFAGTVAPAAAGSGELGPPPSQQARLVYDQAVTVDNDSVRALEDAAAALAQKAASGYAEAEGELLGEAKVMAGTVLDIDGVPEQFAGTWTISRARHVFDHNDGGGYRTQFTVSGRQDRSLHALSSANGGGKSRGPTRVSGVVGGVVTSIEDPLGLGRVKVALPWLSPEFETSWAPVTQLTAGKNTGAMFLPEPGDQVLVSFEFGDLRRPYVIGSIVNKRTGAGGVIEPGGSEPGKAVVKAGRPATVIRRGFVSPTGSRLVFYDDGPPGGGRPTASQVVLATEKDKVGLLLDQVAGTLSLVCKPGSPPGKLVIECDGNVEIKAGPSGTLTVDGGQQLTLKGKTVQIEGTGPVAVKGKPIQLN